MLRPAKTDGRIDNQIEPAVAETEQDAPPLPPAVTYPALPEMSGGKIFAPLCGRISGSRS